MKICVFGASGRTGRQVIQQALAFGHDVTAVVRNPDRFTIRFDRLRVITGDSLDAASFSDALPGHDGVVSVLGVTGVFQSLRPMSFYVDAGRAITQAMRTQAVPRLLALTSIGVLQNSATPMWYRSFVRPLLRHKYADMRAMEEVIRESGLDFTIVRPVRLTDGPLTQRYRVGGDGSLPDGGAISRADVADFVVRNMADGQFRNRAVALSY